MRRSLSLACAGLATVLIATALPGTAEARFGKRSDSDDDNNKKSKSQSSPTVHQAAPAIRPGSSNPAPAQRVYQAAPATPTYAAEPRQDYRHHHALRPYYPPPYFGWGWGYYPVFAPPPPPPPTYYLAPPDPQPSSLRLSLGASGQWHSQGGMAEFSAALEGERFGLNGSVAAFVASAGTDASGNELVADLVQTYDLHLTYALLAAPRGRLRLEAGISGAVAPDLAVLGPDLGASAALGLAGPLGLEAGAWVTPFPYRRIQSLAGLSLALGPFGIRGGYRLTWLDDAGLLGERHTDTFAGPYLGLGIVF